MNSQSDEINLELTNEEVDDALNFGMTFDDIQDSLQAEDTALPTLNTGASLGTCSPTPSFDDESLTSTGSKRSRAEYCSIDDDEDGPHHKRRVNYSNRGGAVSADVSGNNSAGGNNAALSAIRLDREREGRCPDCGLETHSVERSEKGYKKTPLNVEGEVLDGRCLFCHPLEEGESPKKSEKGASKSAPMDVAGAQKKTLQFDAEMMTLQQNRRAALAAPNHAPIQSRKSPVVRQSGDKKDPRKHSWRERTRMNPNDDKDDNPSVKGSLTDDDGSQYSSRSQISDGIGHLGKAMASGMGMNCTDQPNNTMTRQNSKSPHTSRNSPKGTRDPSSNATPISYQSNSGNSPLGGSDRANNEQDVPAHVRLAHNKLPSSIYHHHLFPMSKETEQAYIEKTLAYLESGGGDIVDVIAAMRRFPFSLPVQSLCCEKLYVHCFDNDHAHAIVLVGGIRTVIDAMEHHSKDMALQRGCAGIIKHMATASKYNLEMLDKMGAIQVIVNAMRGNAHSPALLESCCWTLATMARGPNPEIKLRIAKAGGVHACMTAVEMYPKNESLLRAAFNALNFFGYNPASHTADVARMQQNQQQQQRQIHNQQMQRQQFEQAMIQSGNGRASGGNQHPNQVQQQLQRMMQNNEMQEMNMNQVQQQQLQRMMSKNEMNQMQQNQQQLNEMKQLQQNQQQLLNRHWQQQQQQQQMLAMSQPDGLPTNEMRMRMQTVNNIGNAQMGNGRSNNSTPGNDGVNFSLGNSNSGRRRM